jgi:ferritin-like metal-binding protein YciE
MKQKDLYRLFLDEIESIYDGEQQIAQILPKIIEQAYSPELKKTLSSHLHETRGHIKNLQSIFSILEVTPQEKVCEAIESMLAEAELSIRKRKNFVLDAALISALQKIKHYEISCYGTLNSFAKYLELSSEIKHILHEMSQEERNADKALTKLAESDALSAGINEKAV